MTMLETLFYINSAAILMMLITKDNTKSLIFGGISAFLGFGAYRLSFDGTNYPYAFIPLSFVIISVIWMIYIVYGIIAENNKKDWGTDVEGLDKV